MPAKSKKQLRFIQSIAHGGVKVPGFSKEEAEEYASHNTGEMSYNKLPEKVKKSKARKAALEKIKNG